MYINIVNYLTICNLGTLFKSLFPNLGEAARTVVAIQRSNICNYQIIFILLL